MWVCTLGIIFIGLASCVYTYIFDMVGAVANMIP